MRGTSSEEATTARNGATSRAEEQVVSVGTHSEHILESGRSFLRNEPTAKS